MTQSTKAILRFGRGTVIAATIVGTSGLLEAAGLPTLSGIVQNLGAAQSEARRLRDKTAHASAIRDTQSLREITVNANVTQSFMHPTKVRLG